MIMMIISNSIFEFIHPINALKTGLFWWKQKTFCAIAFGCIYMEIFEEKILCVLLCAPLVITDAMMLWCQMVTGHLG